ncbi:MAG: helix-turn-helix transcriptional regulator [Clostridium sp.]|nr:helix-turn-helix transcriptional regulator [Clostridium sp.]
MAIGEKLARIIKEKNRNVNDIASSTGVNAQTIYSIIKRNNTKADLDDLFLICDELGISIDEFRSDDIFNRDNADVQFNNLTDDETRLIKAFRSLSTEDRNALIRLAEYADKATNSQHVQSLEGEALAASMYIEQISCSQSESREVDSK